MDSSESAGSLREEFLTPMTQMTQILRGRRDAAKGREGGRVLDRMNRIDRIFKKEKGFSQQLV